MQNGPLYWCVVMENLNISCRNDPHLDDSRFRKKAGALAMNTPCYALLFSCCHTKLGFLVFQRALYGIIDSYLTH